MGPDLDSGEAQLDHAAFQLPHRQIGVLHRDGPESNEPGRVIPHYAGDMIVEELGEIVRVVGAGPVAEHDRNRGQHLHPHAVAIALLQPADGVPAVVADFPEGPAVDYHARPAGLVVLESHEPAVAVPFPKIGPVLRKDVGMQVDPELWRSGQRSSYLAAAAGGAGTCMT
jgi:hypothetical protein